MTDAEGRYVRANGLDIFYEEHGAGEPLILLHGGMVTGRHNWGPHIPAFAAYFRTFVPDSRGHGRTANPTGEISYPLMAEDVVAFAGELGLERPAILGFSDGGLVALEIGMRHPDLARALVVGGAAHRLTGGNEAIAPILGLDADGNPDPDRVGREHPEMAGFFRSAHAAQGDDHWKTLVRQIAPVWVNQPEYTADDLRRIAAPTLAFVGDRDEMYSVEIVTALYRMLPQGELFVVPGQGHMGELSARARQTLIEFLLRQGGGAGG